jgi:hypothetical protein
VQKKKGLGSGLMTTGPSQIPIHSAGPAATRDLGWFIKEKEDDLQMKKGGNVVLDTSRLSSKMLATRR